MTPTDKLIADGLWRDISEAPRDGAIYLGAIIQPDGRFGQAFEATFDDDMGRHSCVIVTEFKPHLPTHFRPIPDDRLANALRVAVEALRELQVEYKKINHVDAVGASIKADEALARINRIAEGE